MTTEIVTRVEFDVADRLVVSDPCYIDKDDTVGGQTVEMAVSGLGLVLEGCAGGWTAEVEFEDNRVSTLRAVKRNRYDGEWRRADTEGACVDSGQMFVGDAEAFGLDYDALLARYEKADGEWDERLHFFAFLEGAVSSTGYGDGCYPVYVKYDAEGAVVGVEVRFMEDDEEDGG